MYHDHYVDNEIGQYYTRLQWDLADFLVADREICDHVAPLVGEGDAQWSLSFSDRPRRMAVFVSREPWCLYDILARAFSGEWPVEIPLIVAHHPDLKSVADRFGIAFHVGQAREEITRDLPAEAVLYTPFARTCDPVVDFLKRSGAYSDAQIIELMHTAAFGGLAARQAPVGSRAKAT